MQSVLINFGDDFNDLKGNCVPLPSPVPEPSSWALLLLGAAGLAFKANRRNQAADQA